MNYSELMKSRLPENRNILVLTFLVSGKLHEY